MKNNLKKILGLDLGTNSIGWALVEIDHEHGRVRVLGLGSRILPMDAGEIGEFEHGGKIKSTAAKRTEKRGVRRLNERYLLRRDRLHLVLNILESLPEDYKVEIDFEKNGKRSGKFKKNAEPKLAYFPKENGKKAKFRFIQRYREMLHELGCNDHTRTPVPFDWTLYYLRYKSLIDSDFKMGLEELAWVLLSYNQKRGYEKLEIEDFSMADKNIEKFDLQVISVDEVNSEKRKYFKIQLEGNDKIEYKEYTTRQLTEIGDIKEVVVTTKVDAQGNLNQKSKEIKVIDIYNLKVTEVASRRDVNNFVFTIKYDNGWEEEKKKKKWTSEFYKAKGNSYDLIVETKYETNDKITRSIRQPNYGDNSDDWTLLKKKTEKEALITNASMELVDEGTGKVKRYISIDIFNTLREDFKVKRHYTKINGGKFQVVEREFYREELNDIIRNQSKFHNNLKDRQLFEKAVNLLYPNNKAHANQLKQNRLALQNLLVNDILLYQRELKSKKSEIANCKYEIAHIAEKEVVNKNSGEIETHETPYYKKTVSVSHPFYQEFRIWDKLHNLKLIQLEKTVNGKLSTNVNVSDEYLDEETYVKLYEHLNNNTSIKMKEFLELIQSKIKKQGFNTKDFVWNFLADEELLGNETRVKFVTRFKRCGFTGYCDFLTLQKAQQLWHYLYSVNNKQRVDKDMKSLRTFFGKWLDGAEVSSEIREKLINDFASFPKFKPKYGAFSEKALKKFIPIMRLTHKDFAYPWENEDWYTKWNTNLEVRKEEILNRLSTIDFDSKEIDYTKAVDINADIPFPRGLFNVFRDFHAVVDFSKLNLTKASYLIYGRHSEVAKVIQWCDSPNQIRENIHHELKQHSLNNPIAEKVLLEMMQVVADIWEFYGNKINDLHVELPFDKIHVEVGRELKKSAKEKDRETKRQRGNRVQNDRIRQVLKEFVNEAIPNNKDHFERLKIVEEGAEHQMNANEKLFEDEKLINANIRKSDIEAILKKDELTNSDFEKYKLWVQQGYKSPYTNKVIKFSDLFNGVKYNIDHILPQALVTNNSLSNKVVCETEVNNIKGNKTGREFILNPTKAMVSCVAYGGREVRIVNDDEYTQLVKQQFSGTKRLILLSKEIPSGFTSSQLNTTRHISRKAMELLSNIVRKADEVEFRSKNVLPVVGRITSELKKAWRLNEVWKELVAPRFKRMNELTESSLFGESRTSKNGQTYFNCNLDQALRVKNPSYNIKRIDHRHHALDALIVALCTEEHVNYLNNINAMPTSKDYGKQKKIEAFRATLKRKIKFSKPTPSKQNPNNKNWYFMLPGERRMAEEQNSDYDTVLSKTYFWKDIDCKKDFKKMVLLALQDVIPSFKQPKSNIRKTSNKYMSYYNESGDKKNQKSWTKQIDRNSSQYKSSNNRNIAIRKSMHDDIPYGLGKVKFDWLKIKDNVGRRDDLIDEDIKLKVIDAYVQNDESIARTKEYLNKHPLKDEYGQPILNAAYRIQGSDNQNAYIIRKSLNEITNQDQLRRVSSWMIQKELTMHLHKYDTIVVPFSIAKDYIPSSLEENKLISICKMDENFKSLSDLITFLENNNYQYKKEDYSSLNLFLSETKSKLDSSMYQVNNNFDLAFSPNGIHALNKHRNVPIYKVKLMNRGKGRYHLGNKNGNHSKMVKGANSLFIIDRNAKKEYSTLKLVDEIKNYLEGTQLGTIDTKNRFVLKAGDLVYVPTDEELSDSVKISIDDLDIKRIYKFVKSSGSTADFVQCHIASVLYNYKSKNAADNEALKIIKVKSHSGMKMSNGKFFKNEIGIGSAQDKNQNMLDRKTQIKARCLKLKVNRVGNITEIIQ